MLMAHYCILMKVGMITYFTFYWTISRSGLQCLSVKATQRHPMGTQRLGRHFVWCSASRSGLLLLRPLLWWLVTRATHGLSWTLDALRVSTIPSTQCIMDTMYSRKLCTEVISNSMIWILSVLYLYLIQYWYLMFLKINICGRLKDGEIYVHLAVFCLIPWYCIFSWSEIWESEYYSQIIL